MSTPLSRRNFLGTSALLTLGAAAGAQEGTPGITVGIITNDTGAHLSAYYGGLMKAKAAGPVVLSDPGGSQVKEARKALGDKLKAVYTDREEMLAKEQPALALVTMEARLAPEAINAALDAGCHVLAEKPACVRAEDFAPLAAKAEAKGLHLMLALANRLNPEVFKAKELIASGEIGAVYGMEIRFVEDQGRLTSPSYHGRWYADKARAGGGHLTWLGIHWLDLAMYITGSPVTHVSGFSGNIGGQPINIEDSNALTLRFGNGAFGTMLSGYYRKTGEEQFLRIWGSKGWLEMDSTRKGQLRWTHTEVEKPKEQVYNGPEGHHHYTAYVDACVRASAGLAPPPMTPAESLRVLKTIYTFYDAAEQGKTLAVE